MKNQSFLKKAVFGVPVWVLLSVALVSAAVYTMTSVSITAKEPFSTISASPTSIELYPGEYQDITETITNDAPVEYGIIISHSGYAPCTLSYVSVDGTVMTEYDTSDVNALKVNLKQGTGTATVRIKLPDDAPGTATCSLSINVERLAKFV